MRRHNYEEIRQETSNLKQILDEKLVDINYEIGLEYVEWLERQTEYFEQSYKKLGYGTQPDSLKRGDIIWVEFGINIGTELSDFNTRGHYAVCWAVDLGNLIVIPLSSRDAPGSALTFDLGVIEGLGDDGRHSYLKLDAIRSVSKRRIARMANSATGKIELPDETVKAIQEAIRNSFVD